MNTELGLVASAALIVTGVSAIVALFSRLALPWVAVRLERLPPPTRANVLWWWAVLPLLLGLAALFIVLLPSFAHMLGIAADHCLEHGHHGHLCLVHSPLFAGTALETGILVAVGSIVCMRLSAILAPYLRGRRLLAAVLSMSDRTGESQGYRLLPSNRFFAFTAGMLRPRVYVSSRLAEDLNQAEFQAVLLHENCHRLRRDGLRKLGAQLLSFAHFPATRHTLLAELGLATEQSCDEHAARSLGDRLTVAETIVKLSRLSSLKPDGDSMVSAFSASDPRRRVAGLLNPPIPRRRFLTALGLVLVVALSVSGFATAEFWHHGAESLFGTHAG